MAYNRASAPVARPDADSQSQKEIVQILAQLERLERSVHELSEVSRASDFCSQLHSRLEHTRSLALNLHPNATQVLPPPTSASIGR